MTLCYVGICELIWWACWRELRRIWDGGEPMPKHVIAALRQKRQAGDEVVETVIGTVEAPDNLHAEGKAHKIFGFHVTVRSAIEHQFVLEERSAAKRSTRPKPAHAKRA